MERKCASNWSSIDAIGDESEMIAHLQSMFWSSSDVDLNLCSSNVSVSSCVPASTVPSSLFLSRNNEGYCTMPLVNTSMDMGFDHQFRTFISTNEAVVADRRMFKMDEKKNPNKKLHTVPSALTRAGSSSILNGVTNTKLVGHSSCSSEEDSIGTTEKSVVLNRTDKSRARKRSSKNSQSIYAKKRRERISERLKILQKLIPNGTKVDISTMLEDAVHYVKFLQLQIKLLSSDEMWMFAPSPTTASTSVSI